MCRFTQNDPVGGNLQPLVDMVGTHGTEAILNAVDRPDAEDTADVAVATSHRSEGRRWVSVRTGVDCAPAR